MERKTKVVLTGATGMVGEGVLHECLQNDSIDEVLSISRRSCGTSHPKLKELIHDDFFNLSALEYQLAGYDACFFCLGVSSVGMNKDEYVHLTYDLTMHVATTLARYNPGMTFCYISGAGTDSSGKGRLAWARVKGKTENDLMLLPFQKVYNFRPGILRPTPGLKNTLSAYKYFTWLFPVFQKLFPGFVCTLRELGLAMIHAVIIGYEKSILEVKDIVELSKASTNKS